MERDLPKLDLETLVQQVETERTREIVLETDNQSINLEITDQCYANCEECYTDGRAAPKGREVPLEVIAARLEWIKRFTDAKYLYFLGGEPLLHSQFQEIIKLAQAEGFNINIITAGMISRRRHEKENLEYLLAEYENGNVDIELSYHPKRNEKAFRKIYQRCKAAAALRKTNLAAKKKELEEFVQRLQSFPVSRDAALMLSNAKQALEIAEIVLNQASLNSTVTLADSIIESEADFFNVFRFLCELRGKVFEESTFTFGGKASRPAPEFLSEQYQLFQKHFADFIQSSPYNNIFWNDWEDGWHFSFRVWGATIVKTEVIKGQSVRIIKRPMGTSAAPQMCPAMESNFDQPDKIKIQTPLIRTDGEITFANPSCIEVKSGLANADRDFEPEVIYRKVKARIKETDKLIHMVDRKHLSGREDDGDCHSCPFDSACRLCHAIQKSKQFSN